MSQRICSVQGCPTPVRYIARGWCAKHYARWSRTGSPDTPSCLDPFDVKVERYTARQPNGCWLWTGPTDVRGYGCMESGGKPILIHRYMLERSGVDVSGLFVCHHCDVRNCVNPAHLYAGTNQDNMRDRLERGGYVGLPGESNPFAKLSDTQVDQIRSMYATGAYAQRELARHFGVAQSHIGRIVRREAWKEST